jgi:hypothetical protein
MFFDSTGYQTVVADRNDNEQRLHYQRTTWGNRNTGVLTHVTDATGRRVLTRDYHQPGDDYFVSARSASARAPEPGVRQLSERGIAVKVIEGTSSDQLIEKIGQLHCGGVVEEFLRTEPVEQALLGKGQSQCWISEQWLVGSCGG